MPGEQFKIVDLIGKRAPVQNQTKIAAPIVVESKPIVVESKPSVVGSRPVAPTPPPKQTKKVEVPAPKVVVESKPVAPKPTKGIQAPPI